MNTIETILKSCKGVEVKTTPGKNWRNETIYNSVFLKVGDIVIPDDTFIEITATATKGTIGRVLDIKVQTYNEAYTHAHGQPGNQLVTYNTTIIFEVDGRKKPGRINSSYTKVLVGQHQTKYVRDINTHDKVEVKNPINKYKQEMKKGDWVIGVTPGKGLGIGRITRWTNHNVWAVKPGDELNDKSREFKFDSIDQTFTMPDSDQVQQLLTVAILKGYTGS